MNAGTKWYFCFRIVVSEEVWRKINCISICNDFNRRLTNLQCTPNAGANGFQNSLGYTVRQLSIIFDRYECIFQAWCNLGRNLSEDDVKLAFIESWQTVAFTGEDRLRTGWPGVLSNTRDGLSYFNTSSSFFGNYINANFNCYQFTTNRPFVFIDSVVDRLSVSNILTSNQSNLVGRPITPITIAEIISPVTQPARQIANQAAGEIAQVVRETVSEASDAARILANEGIERVRDSGIIPFTSNESQAIFQAALIIGGAAVLIWVVKEVRK